jgi:hypothetical protein
LTTCCMVPKRKTLLSRPFGKDPRREDENGNPFDR